MMYLSVIVCLLSLLLCGDVNAITGNPGHDRPYGDLPNMPITFSDSQTVDNCEALCAANSSCKAWVFAPANCNSGPTKLCWLKAEAVPITVDSCKTSGTKDHSLLPKKYPSFPVGSVLPSGWLKNQLQTQANGLCGYLSEFWGSINQSAWIGHAGGDAFERVPYWLNGIIPLAYQTNDANIFSQMHRYLDFIIQNQAADGWLGPACSPMSSCDPWPRFPMLLALTQYHEANSSDARVVPAIWKFILRVRLQIEAYPLHDWAQYRVHDLLLTVHWLYDNYPQGQEQVLYDLAEVIYKQGFQWGTFFASSDFPKGKCTGNCPSYATHGVNVGQALKSGAVWYRQSKQQSDVDSSYSRIATLNKYHGLASGIFGCDEHLAGNMPSQGSELCTVVETMYSFEEMYSILGDPIFGDYIEKLTFNALPATITPDMWAHQYLQQPNEINAAHNDPSIYTTDGPDSNIYGLEPNFGCCTANFPQGWPKFTSHLYLQSQDNGVVAAMFAPSTLTTTIKNNKITIAQDTNYPFDSVINFAVNAQSAFPFYLRIPKWAAGATVMVGSNSRTATPGQHFLVSVAAGQTKVTLTLPMSFSIERRYNNAAALSLGPLVFAMDIAPKWTELRHYSYNSSDLQALPVGPWAYAIDISDKDPEKYLKVARNPVGNQPFSEAGSPIVLTANARQITWGVHNGAAVAPPTSPVSSSSPVEQVKLLPFGATKLRILEMPTLNQ